MGIKHLNRYLQNNCHNGIKKNSFWELSGKKIAIDTSIYLYRFLGEDALLENLYLMIATFREYNIIPLFVFDGKPPKEKNALIMERKEMKQRAKDQYNKLEDKLIQADVDDNERNEITDSMNQLKKQFIRLHHTHIEKAKALIQTMGISYIEAPCEADELCAKLVLKHKVYACLSEDMDLFVYGCPRVLRYLSLLHKSVVMYDLNIILNELHVSMDDFRNICIVSGTDYNINKNTSLFKTLKLFNKYKQSFIQNTIYNTIHNNNEKNDSAHVNKNNNSANKKIKEKNKKGKNKKGKNKKNNDIKKPICFIDWLHENTDYIENIYEIYNTTALFDLSTFKYMNLIDNIKVVNSSINRPNLINIMKEEDFVFVS